MMNPTMPGPKNFKGLIHIHSNHSYDGTLSLTEIVELAKKRHCDFIILTEHAEDFNENKMQILVDDCTKSSDKDFLVIPGLEFNLGDQIHILGIGIEKYINKTDPEELIRKIHDNKGLAILAHTAYYKKITSAPIKDVDLIEIWNPRYGERLSPSIKSIKILYEFRKMKQEYIASGGLDLHKMKDFIPLYQLVYSERLNQTAILNSLRCGRFITTNGFIELPPLKKPSIALTGIFYFFAFVQFIPYCIKKIFKKIYKIFCSRM